MDRLGSLRNVVNNGGTAIDTITYDGFGNITSESNSAIGSTYKYALYRYDTEIAHYLGDTSVRPYEAIIGRFSKPDPIGLLAGYTNLFIYCGNNAPNAIDPSGLQSKNAEWPIGKVPNPNSPSRSQLLSGTYKHWIDDPSRANKPDNAEGYICFSQGTASSGVVLNHISIVIWDPKNSVGIAYDGGGAGASGLVFVSKLFNVSSKIRDLKGFDKRKCIPIDIGAVSYNTAKEHFNNVYWQLRQITPYNPYPGPNSNTYARQFLVLARVPIPTFEQNAPGRNYDGEDRYGGSNFDEYGVRRVRNRTLDELLDAYKRMKEMEYQEQLERQRRLRCPED